MLFDPLYIGIFVLGLLLSGGAAMLVKLQFARGRKVPMTSGITGREVAERILRDAGITDVQVLENPGGMLSDHYHPTHKTLNLSPEVYHGDDAAAAGVAAHEVGHALQHAQGYAPMWLRSALVPAANLGSMLGPYVVFAGVVMGAAHEAVRGIHGGAYWIAVAGVALFAMATLFTVVTVPVEYDASARAKERLVTLGITRRPEEDAAVRGVLSAAGLTYLAAAASSIMLLLYWAMRAGLIGGGRRD